MIKYQANGRIKSIDESSLDESKVTWNGRPNLNGNNPESFKKAGRELHDLGQKTYEKLQKSPVFEIMHGRNYQTLGNNATAAAAYDRARIEKIFEALRDLQNLGLDIYTIGDNQYEG